MASGPVQLRISRRQPEPMPITSVRQVPVVLTPIPWGKPDRALAKAVCEHIAEVTPPTRIFHNPFTEQRMRRTLRSIRIAHD